MSIHLGPKQFGHLAMKSMCDECGNARSKGSHERCSRRRQVRTAELSSSFSPPSMSELAAAAAHRSQSAETQKRYNALVSSAGNE
ncbi:hypothetical protein WG29040_23330 [Pseudomonas sp. PAMC 29040]|nr:hypothetical protein WG29040_23330 [Pseudomonas sp. PAMC 29040]